MEYRFITDTKLAFVINQSLIYTVASFCWTQYIVGRFILQRFSQICKPMHRFFVVL